MPRAQELASEARAGAGVGSCPKFGYKVATHIHSIIATIAISKALQLPAFIYLLLLTTANACSCLLPFAPQAHSIHLLLRQLLMLLRQLLAAAAAATGRVAMYTTLRQS